jgi:hypothetical protein
MLAVCGLRRCDQRSRCRTRSTKTATWSAAKRMLPKPSMFHSLEISASSLLGGRPPRPVAAAQGLKGQVNVPASYHDSHAGQLSGLLVGIECSSDPSGIRNGEGPLGSPDADRAHARLPG